MQERLIGNIVRSMLNDIRCRIKIELDQKEKGIQGMISSIDIIGLNLNRWTIGRNWKRVTLILGGLKEIPKMNKYNKVDMLFSKVNVNILDSNFRRRQNTMRKNGWLKSTLIRNRNKYLMIALCKSSLSIFEWKRRWIESIAIVWFPLWYSDGMGQRSTSGSSPVGT